MYDVRTDLSDHPLQITKHHQYLDIFLQCLWDMSGLSSVVVPFQALTISADRFPSCNDMLHSADVVGHKLTKVGTIDPEALMRWADSLPMRLLLLHALAACRVDFSVAASALFTWEGPPDGPA